MKVGVVGLGKLGLPAALVFCKAGYEVKGVEINPNRLRDIAENRRFVEPQINEYLEVYGSRLEATHDIGVLKGCPIVFILVSTPSFPSGKFNIDYVEIAIREVHEVNPSCVVVVNSTVNPGDFDSRLKPLHSHVLYNPVFVHQGSVIHDFENPKFLLVGSYTEGDQRLLTDIWNGVIRDRLVRLLNVVSPIEAEIAKLSLNVSYTLGISFANVVGEVCEKMEVDSHKIMDIIYSDRRNYYPGLGFGGPCFPRDTKCFRDSCLEIEAYSGCMLGSLLDELNAYTVKRYVTEILREKPRTVIFLGVGYKDGVDLIDESQPVQIVKMLIEKAPEVKIYVYDPLCRGKAKAELPETVEFCEDPEELEADVVFVGTPKQASRAIGTHGRIINPWR